MAIVTKLTAGKSRGDRLNVFLDGKFSFSLLTEVALKEGLRVEQELSVSQVESLTRSDRYQRCLNAAIRYLGYRPRSEAEVRQRLQRHGFDDDSINKTIAKLKEQGLVDDAAFARFWKENRETFSPRSRWLTGQELKRKGLDNNVIEQIVGEVDDSDSAYRAALSKARRLSSSDYQDFHRRLGEYLRRRGFNYQVINDTVERIWKERGGNNE
jgi:regulatory protein